MPSTDKLGVAVDGAQLPVEEPIQIDLHKHSMISAKIGEETMGCLIDTGATCSLVSESYYKENPVFKRFRLIKPKFDHATTANGSRIASAGFLNVPLHILGSRFIVPFYVSSGLHNKFILGYEFLSAKKGLCRLLNFVFIGRTNCEL